MFDWFRKKKQIGEAVFERKEVVVHGVPFVLRKVGLVDHLNGSKVLIQVYDTYRATKTAPDAGSMKKVHDHMKDTILAGVVEPKLTRKKGDGGFFVDDLFENMEFASAVYLEVLEFTYGKKKLQSLIFRGKELLTSTSSPAGTA